MLNDQERYALQQWYGEKRVLEEVKRLLDMEDYEELEQYLHMSCLFPLSRHSDLPDYMRNEEGEPLFPTNLNPRHDLELWQDAIEVGWRVVEEKFGLGRDEVHRRIASEQQKSWETFLRSVEQRKKERGLSQAPPPGRPGRPS